MPKPNHRQAILDAALAVFHKDGFHASGVQEVVDFAGIPKGSFYNHFKSKEDLGLAVIDRYWEMGQHGFAVLRDSHVAPLDRIDRYLASFGYQENGCLLGNFSAELSQNDLFRGKLRAVFKLWTKEVSLCIESGQKDGGIRTDFSAMDLAATVIAHLEGAILASRVEQDVTPMIRMREATRAWLARPRQGPV